MLFDLKKFFNAGKVPEERVYDVDFTTCDFSGSIMKAPVPVEFVATRNGEEILLTLRSRATIQTQCARCLDDIEQEKAVDVEWIVRERDLEDPDFELPVDEKGRLDIDEWLHQEFMFEIPMVLVCSADCVGLCPVCGKKAADCTCAKAQEEETAPLDPRLSVLKTLLN